MYTHDQAITKFCPYTFGVPRQNAISDEYKCVGKYCMAWIKLRFSDLTSPDNYGYCKIFNNYPVGKVKSNENLSG